jgi:hypothetical protein
MSDLDFLNEKYDRLVLLFLYLWEAALTKCF